MKKLFYFFALSLISSTNFAQIITTIAGNGTAGYSGDGGAATGATVNQPTTLAVDASGNIYIADANNNVIRKVNTSGIITTIAGNGTAGYSGDGGSATSASLNLPFGVRVDAAGNLYIADANNNVIRKVNTSGIITTVAGTGVGGYSGDSGPATSAQLNFCTGVAVDAIGNIYISDDNNDFIRKVDVSGIITTVAGNGTCGYTGDGGPATSAQLCFPVGIQTDAAGNLYISDNANYVVRKINTTTGIISTIAGNGTPGYSGDGGPATSAQLLNNFDVTFDADGNFYIADWGNARIRKVNTSGIISTYAGNGGFGYTGDGGLATAAQVGAPTGVVLDAAGNLFIADQQNSVVRKITPSVQGGNGNTCNSAINVDNNNCTQIIVNNPITEWFSFTADSTNEIISIAGDVNPGMAKINTIVIYNGTCINLTEMFSQSLSTIDSQRVFKIFNNLIKGQTYYIKINYSSPLSAPVAVFVCKTLPEPASICPANGCTIINENFNYSSAIVNACTYYSPLSSCNAYFNPFLNTGFPTYQVPCWNDASGSPQILNDMAYMWCDYADNSPNTCFPSSNGPSGSEGIYRNLPITFNPNKIYILKYDYSATNSLTLDELNFYVAHNGANTFPTSLASILNQSFLADQVTNITSQSMQTRTVCFTVPNTYSFDQLIIFPKENNPTIHDANDPHCAPPGALLDNLILYEIDPSATNANITCGQSTTFNICNIPGITYSWAPATGLSCTNCSNPIANPTSTTVYNLTIGGLPCPISKPVTVTVNSTTTPVASFTYIEKNCYTFIFTANFTVCNNASDTYAWNFGDGHTGSGQNAINIYTSAGTYVVVLTVTNSSGISVTYSQTVFIAGGPSCCGLNTHSGRTAITWPTGTTNITTGYNNTDFTALPGATIIINSPTISSNLFITFSNCTFLMYPGSKIVINTKNTTSAPFSNLLDVNFNYCHLYGCSELWEGIRFSHDFIGEPNSLQVYLEFDHTLLEDAWIGIDNSGAYPISVPATNLEPEIVVANSMFNKNNTDLNLDQSRLKPGSFSAKSIYTCRQLPYAPPFIPLPLFTNASTYYASYLGSTPAANVLPSTQAIHPFPGATSSTSGCILYYSQLLPPANAQIFDLSTLPNRPNIFDRHVCGIYGKGINLTINQQSFYNITGQGILSDGNSAIPPILSLGTSASANTFSHCSHGIYTRYQTQSLTASFNNFRDIDYAIRVENFATSASSPNCNILANVINNTRINAIWLNNNVAINANVQQNYILQPVHNITSSGIVVNEATPLSSATYSITQNNTSYTFNGISCAGTYGAQVNNNTVQLYSPNPFPAMYNAGISEVNSSLNIISNNIITGNNVGYSYGQYGIAGKDAPQSQIFCNIITGTNTGLNFQGLMPSHVYTNDLYNQTIDVWLLNSAVIGKQYNPNTSIIIFIPPSIHLAFYQPSDNRYFDVSSTFLYSSYCQSNTNGNNSPFYIRHGVPYDMLVNGFSPPLTINSTPMTPSYPGPFSPYSNNCNACTGLSCRLMGLAHLIAADSLFPPLETRSIFASRRSLFANLLSQNLTPTGDAAIDNFKNSNNNSSIGKFYKVDEDINKAFSTSNLNLLNAANAINNSVNPTDSLQLLQKQVNAAYLYFLQNNFTYNKGNLSTLRGIASLCPFTYGTAVWEARSLLSGVDSVPYFNSCEIITPPVVNSVGQRLANTENTENTNENIGAGIYPNPNTGSFTIAVTGKFSQLTIEIYNTLGDLVLRKENVKDITVDGLQDGVYMVKIIGDGLLIKTEKVLVTK